jgi:exonuclease SbcD
MTALCSTGSGETEGILMRFLHTGDWHVGRTIRGRSRTDEFSAALDEVVAIAVDQEVDAVLLAGDIYDKHVVSHDADVLVFGTLIRLFEAGIPVVAIPGNHDSEARLAAFAPLLARVGTHIVPRVAPPDAGAIVTIDGRDGKQRASIACLPFISPRRFAAAAELFESTSKGYVDFDKGVGEVLRAYEEAWDDSHVNIVMGHIFVSGSQPGGSEREITIGADYAVSPQQLPTTANYIALGHIHKPQKVWGTAVTTRYCGSLLQLDFGERGQNKSVTVIEAAPGRPAKVTDIPITSGRALLDVDVSIADLERVAAEVGDAYLRVNLAVEHATPGLADQVRAALPNALDIRLTLPEREDEVERRSLRGLDPREQFVSYYEHAHRSDPPEEILVAFDRVYEDVND